MSLRTMLRFSGSWWCTALLAGVLGGNYLALSFQGNPYPAWLAFLFHSPAGTAVYSGLIINIAAATIRIIRSRFVRRAVTPETVRAMDAFAEFPITDEQAFHRIAGLLKDRLTVQNIAGQGMRRVTGRYSFAPGAAFRLGLIITLLSLMVSAHTRSVEDAVFHEGEQRSLLGLPVAVESISADLPTDFLQVGDDGAFRLNSLSAVISYKADQERVSPGFPSRFKGRYFRVRHLGFSQELDATLYGKRETITEGLDVLPPGRASILPISSGDAFLTFSLEPDRTITKGLVTGKAYDLSKPRYRIVMQAGAAKGKQPSVLLRPGSSAAIGPASVSLGKQGLSVRIQAVEDPALPFLYAGAVILLIGSCSMPSRFFWYEQEFALCLEGNNLIIGSRDEFFKKWGILRFQRWSDEVSGPKHS